MSKENDKLIKQFQDYLNYERNYSKNTVSSYLNDLDEAKQFFKENGGFSGWDKVKSRDVEIFLQNLATQNRSRTTQARKMSSLRSFYRFLVKREVLENDPMQTISLRLGEKKLPQFFYEKEMRQVFDSLVGHDRLVVRNRAMKTTPKYTAETKNITFKSPKIFIILLLINNETLTKIPAINEIVESIVDLLLSP